MGRSFISLVPSLSSPHLSEIVFSLPCNEKQITTISAVFFSSLLLRHHPTFVPFIPFRQKMKLYSIVMAVMLTGAGLVTVSHHSLLSSNRRVHDSFPHLHDEVREASTQPPRPQWHRYSPIHDAIGVTGGCALLPFGYVECPDLQGPHCETKQRSVLIAYSFGRMLKVRHVTATIRMYQNSTQHVVISNALGNTPVPSVSVHEELEKVKEKAGLDESVYDLAFGRPLQSSSKAKEGNDPRVAKFKILTKKPRSASKWEIDTKRSVSGVLLEVEAGCAGFVANIGFEYKAPPSSELCFAHIGDWGRATRFVEHIAGGMDKIAETTPFAAIIGAGDSFYNTGVKGLDDPQLEATFERQFRRPTLQHIPWYNVLGNHDVKTKGSGNTLVAYTAHSRRWNMPAKSFTLTRFVPFSGTPVLFAFIDTNAEGVLKKMTTPLERFFDRPGVKVLVGHNPVHSGGGAHGAKTGKGQWARKTQRIGKLLLPLLHNAKVHMYLSGDDHSLQILRENTTTFYVSGAGGGTPRFHHAVNITQTLWHSAWKQYGWMRHCTNSTHIHTTVFGEGSGVLHDDLHRTLNG